MEPFLLELRTEWERGAISREGALDRLSLWEDDIASRTDDELEAAWALRQQIEGEATIGPSTVKTDELVRPDPPEASGTAPYSNHPARYMEAPEQPAGGAQVPPARVAPPPPLPRVLPIETPPPPAYLAPVANVPPTQPTPAIRGAWSGAGSSQVPSAPAGGPTYIDRLFDQALAAYQAGQWAGASELLAEVLRQQPGYARGVQSAAALLADANRRLGRPGNAAEVTEQYSTLPSPVVRPAAKSVAEQRSRGPLGATIALLVLVAGGLGLWSMGVFGGRSSTDSPVIIATPTRGAGGGSEPTPAEPTRIESLATPTIFIVDEQPTSKPTVIIPPTVTPTTNVEVRASINDTDVRLREGPAAEYAIIALYPRDATVRVLARYVTSEWLRVAVDADGRTGWIMARWLNITGDTASLPVEEGPGDTVRTADALVNDTGVRLREGPGFNFPIVWQYDTGAPCKVLARSGDESWLKVEMMMPEPRTGWIERKWMRVRVSLSDVPIEGGPQPPARGNVTLQDNTFVGGYTTGRLYNGSTATWIYGRGTVYSTMVSKFGITGQPSGAGTLAIRGLDSEDAYRTPIRIMINDRVIYDGSSPFPDDDAEGPGGPQTWGIERWSFDAAALRSGSNTLTIDNLYSGGTVGKPPFFMLDYAEIEWGN